MCVSNSINVLQVLVHPSISAVRNAGSFHLPYTLSHIEQRVLLCLKLYDKINPDTVSIELIPLFCKTSFSILVYILLFLWLGDDISVVDSV